MRACAATYGIMEVALTNTLQVHLSAIIQLCIAFVLGSI